MGEQHDVLFSMALFALAEITTNSTHISLLDRFTFSQRSALAGRITAGVAVRVH